MISRISTRVGKVAAFHLEDKKEAIKVSSTPTLDIYWTQETGRATMWGGIRSLEEQQIGRVLSVSTIFITNGGVEQIETTKNADVTKYSQTEGARRRELIEIIYMQKRTKACRSSELTPSYQFLHALSKSNPMLHHFAWPPLGISNASKFIFGFFMPREMDLQFPIITLYIFFYSKCWNIFSL